MRRVVLPSLVWKKSGVDGAEQHVAVEDWDDVFTKSCVAHAKVGAAKPLTFVVVHPADYGEAGVIVLLIGLHVHTEWICVREKGAERLVELLVDGDEAAEILDAELDAVYLGQIVQVLPDFFRTRSAYNHPILSSLIILYQVYAPRPTHTVFLEH